MAMVATGNGTATDAADTDKGPGKPEEALPTLIAELAKAPPAVKPDPNVSTAVAAGWHAREALAAAAEADESDAAPKLAMEDAHATIAFRHLKGDLHDLFLSHPVAEKKTGEGTAVHPAPAAFAAHGDGAAVPELDGHFLVKADELAAPDRIALICAQLTADVALLGKPLKAAGQDSGQLTSAIAALASAKTEREAQALVVGSLLAQRLLAADFRLGKGFALGWDMAALADVSAPEADYPAEFARHFVAHAGDITDRLTHLASVLPPNAGHSVRESVLLWTEALAKQGRTVPAPIEVRAMPKLESNERGDLPTFSHGDVTVQLERWRALLTAEKAAHDELELGSYVAVAGGLAGELASAIRSGAGKAKGAMFLLALGIALLIAAGVVAVIVSDSTGMSAAGVTSLVGAAGLTWKGLGSTIGRGLAKVEQPAWDAQMDRVIAEAITNDEIVDRHKGALRKPWRGLLEST